MIGVSWMEVMTVANVCEHIDDTRLTGVHLLAPLQCLLVSSKRYRIVEQEGAPTACCMQSTCGMLPTECALSGLMLSFCLCTVIVIMRIEGIDLSGMHVTLIALLVFAYQGPVRSPAIGLLLHATLQALRLPVCLCVRKSARLEKYLLSHKWFIGRM